MSEIKALEEKVKNLTAEDFAEFREWFMTFDQSRQVSRIPGLHPGAIRMAPDFDEPLPDEFWLGGK